MCVLIAVALWSQGCVIVNKEEKVVRPAPIPSVPADPAIRDIDTVGNLAFADNRRVTYTNIAQREDLSAEAQVHLVEATLEHLPMEDMKVTVLTTLIANPSFSSEARVAIVDRLDQLSFEENKMTVMNALSGN
jgi:hypothetical protein